MLAPKPLSYGAEFWGWLSARSSFPCSGLGCLRRAECSRDITRALLLFQAARLQGVYKDL